MVWCFAFANFIFIDVNIDLNTGMFKVQTMRIERHYLLYLAWIDFNHAHHIVITYWCTHKISNFSLLLGDVNCQQNGLKQNQTMIQTAISIELKGQLHDKGFILYNPFRSKCYYYFKQGGPQCQATKQNSSKKWQRSWHFDLMGLRNNHTSQPCLPKLEFASCHNLWTMEYKQTPQCFHLDFVTIHGIRQTLPH